MELWRRWIAIVVLTSVSGCSFALTSPDPKRAPTAAPECDTGKGLVGLDGVIGGAFAIGSLAALGGDEGEAAAITGLIAVAFIASSVRGNTAVNECRVAMAEFAGRPTLEEEPKVATKRPPPRKPGQPPTVMQQTPPEDPYEPPPQVPGPVVAPVKPAPGKPAPPAPPPQPEPAAEPEDWKDFWTEVP